MPMTKFFTGINFILHHFNSVFPYIKSYHRNFLCKFKGNR